VAPLHPFQLKPVAVTLETVTLVNVDADDATVAMTIGATWNVEVNVTLPDVPDAVEPDSML
jgi:hypothetical protein